jgi:LacI family transcriptional regulator
MAKVTMRDVAMRAGVSAKTVSLVLNHSGFVSLHLTQRVQQAVEELDYHPNGIARSLARQTTETIGVLIPSILSPFYPPVLKQIENQLGASGYSILYANTRDDPATEASLIRLMRSRQVDGLLIASPSPASLPLLCSLREAGVPVVSFHHGLAAGRLDCVTWDDFGGSRAAVRHLINIGRRHIGIIGHQTPGTAPRVRGYHHALAEAGLVPDPVLALELESLEQGRPAPPEHCAEVLLRSLQTGARPDAIFLYSSGYFTLGIMQGIRVAGLRVPEDLAVVAYDDYPWARELVPPLTVVARDGSRLGEMAASLLLGRLQNGLAGGPPPPETIVLPTELIVRGSSVVLKPEMTP